MHKEKVGSKRERGFRLKGFDREGGATNRRPGNQISMYYDSEGDRRVLFGNLGVEQRKP